MSIPINIFIIYAREDKGIKQRLLLHLNPFKNAFNAEIWHDEHIEPGQEWKPHINSRLEQTDLFLLLVSIDFMNSEFINEVEFKYAIDRHRAKKSIVIPVIINYCQWDIDIHFKEYTFNLNELQVLPNEGRPIGDWKTTEEAYNNIAAGIRVVLSTIKNNREQELREEEKQKLEMEIAKKKIEQEQREILEKEKEKDEQLKIERERIDRENVALFKKEQEKKETETNEERENETIEINNDSSFPSSRKKKMIIGAVLVVVGFLFIILFRNSIWPTKVKSDLQSADSSFIATDSSSTTTDSFTPPKIVKDEEVQEPPSVKEKSKKTRIDVVTEEGIKDEGIVAPVESKEGKQIVEEKKEDESEIFEKVEIEASFKGGESAWKKYLERNLNANAPGDNGAPEGTYTVYIQFVVSKDGTISDVKPLTNHGYGMENEAVRVIKKGPPWVPAIQHGRIVNAYRKQPLTFQVTAIKK